MYTANLSAEPANQNAYGSLCISMMSFWRFSNSADPGLAAGNAKQPVCRARHFLVWQLDLGTPSHCLSTVMAPDYFLDYLVARRSYMYVSTFAVCLSWAATFAL